MIAGLVAKWAGLGKAWRIAIGAAGAAAILLGLWLWLDAREAKDDRHNQEIGATVEREAGQARTMGQIGAANEAGHKIRNDAGNARFEQCLRDVAPEYRGNCERYRHDKPLPR